MNVTLQLSHTRVCGASGLSVTLHEQAAWPRQTDTDPAPAGDTRGVTIRRATILYGPAQVTMPVQVSNP